MEKTNREDANDSGRLVSFADFVVDLLGTLVPGGTYVAALVPSVLLPLASLVLSFGEEGSRGPSMEFAPLLTTYASLPLMAGFLVVSYMVGYLFMRQDPKLPDRHSYLKLRQNADYDGPIRNQNTSVEPKVEFPYLHLREYLEDRGFHYLASRVPWQGDKPETHPRRSKRFVNALKRRVAFFEPRRYRGLARNEALVRLMSSAWYMARSLRRVSIFATVAGGAAAGLAYFGGKGIGGVQVLGVAGPLLALAAASGVRSLVESALHYQRVCEVVDVLETAYLTGLSHPEVWSDLEPPRARGPSQSAE